jgi:hypothetical protein
VAIGEQDRPAFAGRGFIDRPLSLVAGSISAGSGTNSDKLQGTSNNQVKNWESLATDDLSLVTVSESEATDGKPIPGVFLESQRSKLQSRQDIATRIATRA